MILRFCAAALLALVPDVFADTPLADSVRRAPEPTAASQIWLDPALPGTAEAQTLAAAGYVREEWFQSGTAKVYGYAPDRSVRVERENVPYTTRVLVLRPRDPRRFSGTVQLNPAHPQLGTHVWSTIADYALEKGDVFVTVMIGADVNTRRASPGPNPVMATKVLGWFNPARYAPIVWPEDEDGIRWDVFADTARLIRSASGPLADLKPTRVYASGWSFTGSFLRTFINSGFHEAARLSDGKPLIDGYLIGISSFSFRSGFVPINSHTPNLPEDDPRRANRPVDVPVIELQSENEAITNREPQTPDRDVVPGAHRFYEVPGLTHGSGRRRSNVADVQIAVRLGETPRVRTDDCPYPQTDVDMAAFAQAAHENLDRWSREGVAPPRAQRLRNVDGLQQRDANGNALGGVRPAQLDVPLASYGPAPEGSGCDAAHRGLGSRAIPMRRVPLSPERLAQLYPGGKAEYLRRFDAAIDALVADRWLRAPDAAAQKAGAHRFAAEAFDAPEAVAAQQTGTAAAASFGRYVPAPQFNETIVTSEYLTMRDGVRIAVSVTRPAVDGQPAPGRYPVIWNASLDIRGPNGDGGPIDTRGGRFGMGSIVGYGYVVVTAARRGSGASFGKRRGYHDRDEAYDAYEITEWAARQPWSSGKVGMFGCSNTGEAVLHAMTVLPPSLTAVFSGCFSWNKFDGMTRGGIIANWGTGPARTIEQDMQATPVDGDEDRGLLRAAAEEHQGSTDLFGLMVGMPWRDSHSALTQSRFWGEGSASSYAPQLSTSRVATYVQGGWYDDFRREGLIAMANLPNRPRIIIGPWTHCSTTGFEEGVAAEALRFFDQHLKGIDTGILRDAPIHYYTVNAPEGTAWRSAERWPLPGTEMRTYYLSGAVDGSALVERPGRRATGTAFTVRREGGCPGEGGARAQPCHIAGAGASWSTSVTAETEITGHPLVDLWIVSDAPDEHVFVYLEDVAPDGTMTIVTEGRLKASLRRLSDAPWQQYGLPWHRSYHEDEQPLEAGVPARLQFDMLPASYVFRKGHRLQITVTGWNPRERLAPATQSIIRVLDTPQHRSTVTLPVAPRR